MTLPRFEFRGSVDQELKVVEADPTLVESLIRRVGVSDQAEFEIHLGAAEVDLMRFLARVLPSLGEAGNALIPRGAANGISHCENRHGLSVQSRHASHLGPSGKCRLLRRV